MIDVGKGPIDFMMGPPKNLASLPDEYMVLFTSDQFLTTSLHRNMDFLSTVVLMVLLALGMLTSFLWIGFQLHGETIHLLRLSSNVISSRPEWVASVYNYTGEQLENNDINLENYVEEAYQQGREWLSTKVRGLADPKDNARADMLEEQVKKITDSIYKLWEERHVNGTAAIATGAAQKDWWGQIKSATNLEAIKNELTLIIKENFDTMFEVAQSVWGLLATNLYFLTGLLAALATIIFDFGMDIINLVIAWVVFLTMLYYLLASSRSQWLPMEWATQLTGMYSAGDGRTSAVNEVTVAVEQAISGVFVLSIKMSVFYGLYTYFVHSLFGLNIVFLPSLVASIFAAIPIMPPYIVCIFGFVELYIVRGEFTAAIVFILMSISPIMFVDAAFYKEVKYAHPYVTGLSIIGGMYWLSLQGAIVGPIILCVFLVMVDVYMKYAKGK
ncbi:unnamed protein product, partial [Mesorhabditis spiculigera]